MDSVSLLLSPLTWAMGILLAAYHGVLGSYGASILLLSVTVRLLTSPILRFAAAAEARERGVRAAMEDELEAIRRESRGRERFERTEALYRRHGYHPIRSAVSLLPLFLLVPFLLAALFLLSDYPSLSGTRFLFLPDLLRPDGLLPVGGASVNLLPLLITALAVGESFVMVGATPASRVRFLVVGTVIAVLIYRAPSGVCLYWATSTVLSFLSSLFRRVRGGGGPAPGGAGTGHS